MPSKRTVEPTADGRHLVIDGRTWRATDPHIPENLKAELVSELMTARRLVKTDPTHARPRVQDAKVALGERGHPWWEPFDAEGTGARIASTIRALLRKRDGSTICPSDAARVVGGDGWRELMEPAREVARALAADDVIEIQQGGERVDPTTATGPIRLAQGTAFPHR